MRQGRTEGPRAVPYACVDGDAAGDLACITIANCARVLLQRCAGSILLYHMKRSPATSYTVHDAWPTLRRPADAIPRCTDAHTHRSRSPRSRGPGRAVVRADVAPRLVRDRQAPA